MNVTCRAYLGTHRIGIWSTHRHWIHKHAHIQAHTQPFLSFSSPPLMRQSGEGVFMQGLKARGFVSHVNFSANLGAPREKVEHTTEEAAVSLMP